ncbi:MAG: carboxymuconolactone decarboxylase family protein [Ferruginibacter sp.]
MTNRISIKDIDPGAYQAMMALENYTKTIQVDAKLKELIKIRASQINRCSYCIDMHTEHAVKLGETVRRIFALSAWKESHQFSERERIVLQLTEEITAIANHGVTDETYNQVITMFGEKTTSQLIMQVILINSWNRIAISTRMIYK